VFRSSGSLDLRLDGEEGGGCRGSLEDKRGNRTSKEKGQPRCLKMSPQGG